MLTWNYRIMRQKDGEYWLYAIHEVYYDDDGEPTMHTKRGVGIAGDDLETLTNDLEHYLDAFNRPILEYGSMKEIEDGG